MAGPYPPHQGTEAAVPYTAPPAFAPGFGEPVSFDPTPYPGTLPPPVPYPKRRRWRAVMVALLAIAAVAGIVAAVVFAVRDDSTSAAGGVITADSAQRAIQNYLDALSNKDLEVVARNALCGLYDGVRDRRSDDAIAKLSSDAFNKQFSGAEVTAVDTIVFASANSAQVLFTMRTTPARGMRGGPEERQGVAQLLSHNNEILVCSYVLRTAGAF